MRVRSLICSCCGLVLIASLAAPGPGQGEIRLTFDDEKSGEVARGFTSEVGRWVVVDLPEGGKAFAQTAKSPGAVFNVALRTGSRARNVEMSVRLRAVAGKEDQGGGVIWRAKDAKNYYIARFNPLEDNFRVYKVVDGKRTQFQNADVKLPGGWHTLKVRMIDDHITCDLDGKTLLDVKDATFADAGMVGLWSKADAQTQFDDLTVKVVE